MSTPSLSNCPLPDQPLTLPSRPHILHDARCGSILTILNASYPCHPHFSSIPSPDAPHIALDTAPRSLSRRHHQCPLSCLASNENKEEKCVGLGFNECIMHHDPGTPHPTPVPSSEPSLSSHLFSSLWINNHSCLGFRGEEHAIKTTSSGVRKPPPCGEPAEYLSLLDTFFAPGCT